MSLAGDGLGCWREDKKEARSNPQNQGHHTPTHAMVQARLEIDSLKQRGDRDTERGRARVRPRVRVRV